MQSWKINKTFILSTCHTLQKSTREAWVNENSRITKIFVNKNVTIIPPSQKNLEILLCCQSIIASKECSYLSSEKHLQIQLVSLKGINQTSPPPAKKKDIYSRTSRCIIITPFQWSHSTAQHSTSKKLLVKDQQGSSKRR